MHLTFVAATLLSEGHASACPHFCAGAERICLHSLTLTPASTDVATGLWPVSSQPDTRFTAASAVAISGGPYAFFRADL
jgi:hypothetical protein